MSTTEVKVDTAKRIDKQAVHEMHYSIAEHGKVLALKNKHEEALQHYREAIRMAVSIKAPEIFFRHYTQCVLESLEITGSHQEVIDYCINADAHYQKIETKIPLHRKDHATTLEKLGINLLKAGHVQAGLESLNRAIDAAGAEVLPLTVELISWLKRGFSVDNARLTALQKKHKYFVVRAGQVDASKGRSLESLKKTPQRASTTLGSIAL